MSWLGDPKLLSVGILIDNLIAIRTSHIPGMYETDKKVAAKAIILELGRRFPNDLPNPDEQVLDAVKGEESSPQVTQNFDVTEKDPDDLDSGWYIAKFIVTEVVELRHDSEGPCVYRIGEERRRSLCEFKFIQRIMLYPNAPKELTKQPELAIYTDFGDLFMNLSRMINHCRDGHMTTKDFQDLSELREMFQNPATIKHKGEAD